MTDIEVKKLLKAGDMATYVGFRDYTAMVLILDCGIRSKELVLLKIKDIDLKQGLLTVLFIPLFHRLQTSLVRSFVKGYLQTYNK